MEYTVLVKYEVFIEGGYSFLDDTPINRSKVVKVKNLTDLNNIFNDNIVDIKILDKLDK